jgi:hypothetical protein
LQYIFIWLFSFHSKESLIPLCKRAQKVSIMASIDTDVSSLVSSVVVAFHGSASTMRTIYAASARRFYAQEELGREKELLDALQAAAQQIARAFAVGKQAIGETYGEGHGECSRFIAK